MAHLEGRVHRVGVLEELPGVTLESSQPWTRGDTQGEGKGEGEWRSGRGTACAKAGRREGVGSQLDPSLAGPCVPGTRLGLAPEAVGAAEGSERRRGVEES